jgi:hypothetical protein
VTCETNGTNGDADLYLCWDTPPDIEGILYDCSSIEAGSVERCTVNDLGIASTLYVSVEAFDAFNDLTVTCGISSSPIVSLVDGIASAPFSLQVYESQTYSMNLKNARGRRDTL